MKEDTITKYQRLRIQKNLGRFLLKYIPYLIALIFVVFCVWRGLGYEKIHVASAFGVCGVLWMPYILVSSTSSGFCLRHRLLILYDFAVALMMYSEVWWGFGVWRRPLNWIFAFLGLAILSSVTIRIIRKKNDC